MAAKYYKKTKQRYKIYQNLSEEEKDKKCYYVHEEHQSLSEEEKKEVSDIEISGK